MPWMWMIALLISGIKTEGLRKISIVEAGKGIGSKGIPFGIVVDTVKEITLDEKEGFEVKLTEDELTITAVKRERVNLVIPADVDTIKVTTISGDVEVSFNVPFSGDQFSITTVGGDVDLTGDIPSNLELSTVSGDVLIRLNPQGAGSPEMSLATVSGDVIVKSLFPGKISIKTVSGDVVVESTDSVFEDSLYSWEVSTITGDVEVPSSIERLVNISKGVGKGKKEEEKERAHLAPYPVPFLSFNRVNGLLIFPTIKNESEQGRYVLSGGYGTASNKFYYLVDLEKYIPVGTARFGVGFSAFYRTVSGDPWKCGLGENSWQALFMKEDLLDFYRAKGFDAYTGFQIGDFSMRVSYVQEKRFSEKVNTNYSVFSKRKDFRDNPSLAEGLNRLIRLQVAYAVASVNAEYYIDNPTNEEVIRIYGDLEKKTSFKYFELFHKVNLGYSTGNAFPYNFTLGGPTTLPGYETGSIATQKFATIQELVIFPTKFVDFVVGAYGGYANDKLYGDLMAGVNIFRGLGVYVTRDKAQNEIKYYMRFNTRI